MFNQFLTTLLHKILQFLVSHKDLFEGERESKLEHLSIPKAFKNYLSEVPESKFLRDVATITLYLEDSKNTNIKHNTFFKSLLEFLTTDLARKIDHLDGNYYLLGNQGKTEVIDQLIKGETLLAYELKKVLTNYNYQQIAEAIYNLGIKAEKIPYLLVQSPREIDSETKKEIRAKLTEEYPLSFPTFQINRRLIGGLRIFKDGNTIDNSWLSRVQSALAL